MSKPTINRLFAGSVLAVVAGMLVAFVAVWLAFLADAFVMDGPDVVGIRWTATTWGLLGVFAAGVLAAIGGCIGGLVSWIGALLNTAQLQAKTWFIVLLILGLWNLGLVAMIAYVIAGPDGTRRSPRDVPAPA
ncbi:MAG TPA: hypothetical protein VFH63_07075 [candidate division Zixibacteria bacterium]|nr:hypothetical protein [candidate division Zixibacteria bacterium]